MSFSDQFLEELSARTDIVELVSHYVELKKRGGSFVGLCPFHSEKTPSFTVTPDKQLFYCFGCSAGGGALQFLMRADNLTFADAVHQLADKAGLAVPDDNADAGARVQRDMIFRLNKEAARHFHANLHTPAGESAAGYLAARGLSAGTIKRFGLGYAPDHWDNLIKSMAEKGFSKSDLLAAGLAVSNKTGGLYDRFRGRLMFPIIDIRGQVIGFGGRVLDNAMPKYLNSPDTPVFSKSRNLFALCTAKQSKQGRIILAEGYMDVLSLHQAGFDCAVASLGTALTPQQAILLARYTKEVVIAYDMDTAGQKAASRAIGILEQSGVTVKVLRLSGAKDPDEYIGRFGRDAFAALLTGSETQMEYRLAVLAGQFDLTADEGRIGFSREAAQILSTLPSDAELDIYAPRAAALCNVTVEALKHDVRRARSQRGKREKKDVTRRATQPARDLQPVARDLRYENTRSAVAEEGIIQMLYANAELAEYAGTRLAPEDFSAPFLGRLFSSAVSHPQSAPGHVFASEDFSQDELAHLTRILYKPRAFADGRRALDDCIEIVLHESSLRRAAQSGEDPLLILQKNKIQIETKGYGG